MQSKKYLIGHFVFPWLRRFGKFFIYIHVLYVLAKGDLIGHFVFPWLRRFGKFFIYIHVLYVLAKGDLIGKNGQKMTN